MLFAPAFLASWLLVRADGRGSLARRAASLALGGALPLAAGALYLAATGSARAWWDRCIAFNRTAPPLPGAWYRLGFQPLVDAALETNALAFVLSVYGAVCLARAGQRRELVRLAGGSLLLLASLAVVRRPYAQYTLPVLTLPAVMGGVAVASLARRVSGSGARLALAAALAAGLVAQRVLPRPWPRPGGASRALPAPPAPAALRPTLREQREHFELVLARTPLDECVFQGHPPFNVFRPDAAFYWFLPFDLHVRGEALGLTQPWSFRDTIRERRPRFVTIGTSRTYASEDTTRHHPWLVGEAGYRYDPDLDLYERLPPGGEAPAGDGKERVGGSPARAGE